MPPAHHRILGWHVRPLGPAWRSSTSWTSKNQNPLHRGALKVIWSSWFCVEHDTEESDSVVSFTPRSFLKFWIWWRNQNRIWKYFILFIRSPEPRWVRNLKNRGKKSRDTLAITQNEVHFQSIVLCILGPPSVPRQLLSAGCTHVGQVNLAGDTQPTPVFPLGLSFVLHYKVFLYIE